MAQEVTLLSNKNLISTFFFIFLRPLISLNELLIFNLLEFEFEFEFWCFMPLSAIFQLYHGDQF